MIYHPIDLTKRWIKSVVLDLNLCPFAHKVFEESQINYVLFEGNDLSKLTNVLWKELSVLAFDEEVNYTTSFIILKDLGGDFFDYLDIVEYANDILNDSEASDLIQIAEFHPDYMFQGTQPNDVENYTNRAPFPMLHLLKEKEVSNALKNYTNPEKIPSQNIQKMNNLGWEGIHQILKKIYDPE